MPADLPEPSDSPTPSAALEAGESTDDTPDEPLTWAGNRPLDTRWWWSPALLVVVGVVVIWFQWSAIGAGSGIALNWVMVAIGAGVVIAGLVSLRRAHAAQRDATGSPAGEGRPTED